MDRRRPRARSRPLARSLVTVALAVGLLASGLVAPATAATISVCASGCDFTSIQAAIDDADAGDTILVGPGDHPDTFTVDVGVAIAAADPDEPPVITGVGTRATIAASGVTLRDLIFDLGADTTTDGVIVIDRVGSWPFSIGFGDITLERIEVLGGRRALFATVEDITIVDSRFEGQARDALFFNAVAGTTTIDGNTFVGGNANKAIVFENFSSGDPGNAGTIRITGNVVDGKRNFVVYNQWLCSTKLPDGAAFVCDEDAANDTVDLVITGNRIGPFGTAIDIFDPSEFGAFDTQRFEKIGSVTVTGNAFVTEGTVGLRAPDALAAEHAVVVDATGNWWGVLTGPASGQVDIGAAGVDTAAFLTPAVTVSGLPTNVANSATSVNPTCVPANPTQVTCVVSGTSGLAVGANTVTFTATLTVAGLQVTNVVTRTVTRAGPTPPATPTPPVPDTVPPPPPPVPPPPPDTPPSPITIPPGQSLIRPPGSGGGFVGGAPVTAVQQQVPPVPPPGQRTPQQVTQVQTVASQIAGAVSTHLPSGARPPLAVLQTPDGALIHGLLASALGEGRSVPAEHVVSLSTDDTTLVLAGADGVGNPTAPSDDGVLRAPQGGGFGTVVSGLVPGSPGQVVIASDPQLLGTFVVDADGVFKGQVAIPTGLDPGDHTLIVNGRGVRGEVTLMLGITVDELTTFPDVVATSPQGQAIHSLTAAGIVDGFADGTYRPTLAVSRAQAATVLARALGLDVAGGSSFDDVVGVHLGAVTAVAEAGVMTGFADGTFRPTDAMTRGQLASALARAAGLGPLADAALSDVAGTHAGAVNAIVDAGLAVGHTDGTFRPQLPATRGQLAVFVDRLVTRVAG
ncbi:MAG TPA: S-layer homology domain-containing protein [Egicoccus sp.]|nr:S-layer homology domain-containing protein [Egicoccus sp.]HSK23017.1 S-layer homology domain-containing protein [Egicoccus sp.]